jgi:hypothetical protein
MMLRKIIKNKVFSSFCKFVLVTALLHIGVLVFRTIKEGNFKLLNYFSILDLNAFFPRIVKGRLSDVISIALMAAIFSTFLTLSLIKSRRMVKIEIKD